MDNKTFACGLQIIRARLLGYVDSPGLRDNSLPGDGLENVQYAQ